MPFFYALSVSANSEGEKAGGENKPTASTEAEFSTTGANQQGIDDKNGSAVLMGAGLAGTVQDFERIMKEQTDRKIEATARVLMSLGKTFASVGAVSYLGSFAMLEPMSLDVVGPLFVTGCALIFSGRSLKKALADKPHKN